MRRHPVPDSLIFLAVNCWAYARHPLLAMTCRRRLGRFANFARPGSLAELMQWRKIFDRNPLLKTFCDKLGARGWALRRMPDLAAADLLWVGSRAGDLPKRFLRPGHVVKMNNGSGRNYFPHRDSWSERDVRRRFRRWLFWPRRHLMEWGYFHIVPIVFVERLVGGTRPVLDLTFRCHDGKVSVAFLATDMKTPRERSGYISPDGRFLPALNTLAPGLELPACFFRARAMAERLSAGIDHVRVDFLVDGEDVWFGEMTCYTASGFGDEEEAGVASTIEADWLACMPMNWFLDRRHGVLRGLYAAAFRRWIAERRGQIAAVSTGTEADPGSAALPLGKAA